MVGFSPYCEYYLSVLLCGYVHEFLWGMHHPLLVYESSRAAILAAIFYPTGGKCGIAYLMGCKKIKRSLEKRKVDAPNSTKKDASKLIKLIYVKLK